MNPLYKIAIELAIVLALIGGGAYLQHRHDAKEIATLTDANGTLTDANTRLVAQRSIDQATLVSLAQSKAVLAHSHATATHSLADAAASAPSWATQLVPKEVQDALKP